MTDIRSRIADTLRKFRHEPMSSEQLADVLLSLPRMAIVDLPQKSDEDGYFIWFDEVSVTVPEGHISWNDGAEKSASDARDLAAALLAAAVQAQEQPNTGSAASLGWGDWNRPDAGAVQAQEEQP